MIVRSIFVILVLFVKCMLGNVYGQSVTDNCDSLRVWIVEGVKNYQAGKYSEATDIIMKVYDVCKNDSVVWKDFTQISGIPLTSYALLLDSLANYNFEFANDELAFVIGEKALDVNRVV